MTHVLSVHFRGDFGDRNARPLLTSDKDADDSWSGWGDGEDWGDSNKFRDQKEEEEEEEDWGSWGKEPVTSATTTTTSQNKKKQQQNDGWENEEWDSFTSSRDKNKNKAKSKPKEPQIANLIDFGDSQDSNNKQEGSWNNDWSVEDDAWQSLEIDSNKQSSKQPRKAKKGD